MAAPQRAKTRREGPLSVRAFAGSMLVRDARPDDARAWREIIMEAAREARQIVTAPEEVWSFEDLSNRIAERHPTKVAFLVAERDGRVVGVLKVARGERVANAHTAELGLTVARDARGAGVGTALMRAAEERACTWGVRKLCLGVFADNARARSLYSRLGFAEEGTRRGHYLVGGALHDEVVMAKWLG